ncbi:hypothetical protein D3C76_1412860 [compost metagenome]
METLRFGGSCSSSSGIFARTSLITSSGLELGVPLMAMYTEGMPLNELIES